MQPLDFVSELEYDMHGDSQGPLWIRSLCPNWNGFLLLKWSRLLQRQQLHAWRNGNYDYMLHLIFPNEFRCGVPNYLRHLWW